MIPSGLTGGNSFRLQFISSTKRATTCDEIAHRNTFTENRAAAWHPAIQACYPQFRAVGANDGQGYDPVPRSLPALSNVTPAHSQPHGRDARKAVGLLPGAGSGVKARSLTVSRFNGGAIWAGQRAALLIEEGETTLSSAPMPPSGGLRLRQIQGDMARRVEFAERDPKVRELRRFANSEPRVQASSPVLDPAPSTESGEGEDSSKPGCIGEFGRNENRLEQWTAFGLEPMYDTSEADSKQKES